MHVVSRVYVMKTSIHLDPSFEQRLDQMAARMACTKTHLLRELIANGLDDLEDCYLATSRMERVRTGEEGVCSAEDVRNDLGLER